MPSSIKFASEKHKLKHRTDTNKLVWETGWISSLQRDHKHTTVATKSGLELCCTSFKDHVLKLCNNNKNCGTCSFAERKITAKGRLDRVFPTRLKKEIEERDWRTQTPGER